jgi:Coenzyme PQQ synthesis protein D (PqqD)
VSGGVTGGVIVRNPAVLWRSTSRGPVVLAPDDETAETLGGLGALVWELLDEPTDLDSLRDAVTALGPDPVPDDIAAAVAELRAVGLLEPA